MLVIQSCPILCNPMDCPPHSFVHWILQTRMLEWVAIPSSRGSSWPRDRTWISCLAGRFLTTSHLELPYICIGWSNFIIFTNFLSEFILISYLSTVLSNDPRCSWEKGGPSVCLTFGLQPWWINLNVKQEVRPCSLNPGSPHRTRSMSHQVKSRFPLILVNVLLIFPHSLWVIPWTNTWQSRLRK